MKTTPQPPAGSASFRVQAPAPGSGEARPGRLSARDLSVGYRAGRPLAAGLDLDLHAGELICLLGPNGAGKSTLLRTLAGLQPPLSGRIELDGRALADWRPRQLARRLAVVLTDRALPGLMTGRDLVRLGRHPHTPWTGSLSQGDIAAMEAALEAVDALHLASRPLAEMSDGERQKVTIARALAQEAEVLVLDEVTAFLDLPRRVDIVRLLRRLAHGGGQAGGEAGGEAGGKAVVLATHDLDLALRSADRLWLLSQNQGDDPAPGSLAQGIPESLVLDGTFERVFAAEGVDFDRRDGSFRLHRQPRGTAWVDGDVLAASWTRRALDRLGYELDPASERRLSVEEAPSGPVWYVAGTAPDGDERYESLAEALDALS